MKADEARKLAEAANTADMKELYSTIKKAVKIGDMHIHYYALIKPEQMKQLRDDGYLVTNVSDRNETIYRISWE